MNLKKILPFAGLVLIVLFVFKNWLLPVELSAGDWNYKFPETIQSFTLYPYAWSPIFSNTMGARVISVLALNTYFSTISKILSSLHIPFVLIERIVWYWPFIALLLISPYILFRKLFPGTSEKYAFLSSFIFSINTYSLMMVAGGQIGVGVGYALVPAILYFALACFSGVVN